MADRLPASPDLAPDEKRRLLGQLLRRQDVVSPLSHGQQALWFLAQLAPESAAYNSSMAVRLSGSVSAAMVRRVLHTLVDRHASLRTTFATLGGDPIQRVRASADPDFKQEDASTWSEEALRERAAGEAHRPFALEHDALLRAVLYTRAPDDHALVLTLHHIIGDFLSFALLFDELMTLLLAQAGDGQAILPPIAAQYTSYVRYQAELLKAPDGVRQCAYWERQLDGELPRLDLGDKPRPSTPGERGAVHAFRLDARLTRALQALAQREGATLYVVLLAAFQLLLHRYTGEQDIIVGSFAQGRTRPEFSRTLGYFVNPIAVRTNVAGDPTFSELTARVRHLVLGALEHQDYPFPLLVERLGLAQDSRYSPVFQVAFNMLKPLRSDRPGLSLSMLNPDTVARQAELPRLEHNGLIVEPFPLPQRAVQFDLELTLDDAGDHINAFLAYNVDLFFLQTLRRMADHFQLLLEGIVANPHRRIGAIPLLLEAERRQVVQTWNDTRAAYPDQACLHQLFEEQVRRSPHTVAVVFGDQQITYADLDARADGLAHRLRALDVGPDVAVGVCLDRSVELVVALLGVLKAGGAYLPLETDAPPARILQLLHDAQAPVCLAQEQPRLQADDSAITVVQVEQQAAPAHQPATAPLVDMSPDNLVSIYYTSGSTGRPKGVANTHRGWVNRIAWMQRRYQLAPGETVLQKTTLTFDDAAVEFFWPLSVGARIALLEPGLHRDPRAILAAAIRYRVAVLQFVPSMLALFLESLTPHDRAGLGSLRHVVSSGEALRADLARLFMERVGCALHNQWGPTETSIDATAHTCVQVEGGAAGVPIGRPIANMRVYVLDDRCRPVPISVQGDLYVAGIGLARGYVADAPRTAEAFLPNPFETGAIMYRTGDRGRLQPDGSIIFLGRRDDQVKIRGQRVELAEIEATLAQHGAVRQCAVLAHKQADGYRLVAYVVPHTADAERADDVPSRLRAFLKDRLPDYMVPGWFILLEALPLTTSGKVDRKRLPVPADDRPVLGQAYVTPRTPTELAVASIWRRVLGLTQIGVHDQFFELGGHSLDATRIVSRIRQEWRIDVPLRAFFEAPTIAWIAAWIDQALLGGDTGTQQPIARLPRQESYELSHAQQRYWFQYQFDPGNAYGALLALDLDGPLDTASMVGALLGLVARHGILRTTYMERDGTPCQVVHDHVPLCYRFHDLSGLAPAPQAGALAQAVVDEKQLPFNLTTGPLFRVSVYKLAALRHRLLLALHPITFDGWSVTVVLEDLQALYHAYRHGGSEGDLPPVAQYVDYAAWLNGRLAAGSLDPQKAYWRKQLANLPSATILPRDESVAAAPHEPMTYRFKDIDDRLARQLHELAKAHGVTLYMALLAGLDMWIARISGQTDITVGSPLSGRTRTELEGIVGALWNPVALRVDLSGNPSYLQVLERVRASALGAYANQEYPFDLIVQDLRQRRGTDEALHAPTTVRPYEVVLVVQNASTISATFDDVQVRLSRSDFLLEGRDPVAEKLGENLHEEQDLHIEVFDIEGTLRTVTRYNPRRFRAATVDRFLDQFVFILGQAVAEPQLRLSQLESYTPSDLDDLFEDASGVA
jgi:amino acid adenylation domain-containing protein